MMLIVEDDEDEIFFLRRAFVKSSTQVALRVVKDGREALAYLFGERQYEDRQLYPLPSLILLDLKLPFVPGIEVLRRIKQVPELKSIIVVIHSSSASPIDVESAYAAGANSYLIKASHLADRERAAAILSEYWFGLNRMARVNNTLIKNSVPAAPVRLGENAE